MQKDIDNDLSRHFENNQREFLDEPFVSITSKRVRAIGFRKRLAKRLLLAVCVIAVIALSPWLIDASIWISGRLETVFTAVATLIETPVGMLIVGAFLAPLIFLNRKKIF